MDDFEIEYKLNSIMDNLKAGAVKLDSDEQVYISIPADRIRSLELYGIKQPHMILWDTFEKKNFFISIDDDDQDKNGKPVSSIAMIADKLSDYKKLVSTFYGYWKDIASRQENIIITFEEDNVVIISLPLLSLFRTPERTENKELNLLMELVRDGLTKKFGDKSFQSVGIRMDELKMLPIGKYFLTIDFVNRDKTLNQLEDIDAISKIAFDSSLKALNIIFNDYLK